MAWLRTSWGLLLALSVGGSFASACGDDDDGSGLPVDDGGLVLDGGDEPDGGDETDAGMDDAPFTEAEVQQLFVDNNCTTGPCHSATAPQLGLNLTAFVVATVNVPAMQSPLDRIEPGDHTQSYLWHKVNGTHTVPPADGEGLRMPRGGVPLSEEEIGRLAGYIDALPVE